MFWTVLQSACQYLKASRLLLLEYYISAIARSRSLLTFYDINKENKVLMYTARTIVERGIVPTVSKTHFPPSDKKSFQKSVGAGARAARFLRMIPEAKEALMRDGLGGTEHFKTKVPLDMRTPGEDLGIYRNLAEPVFFRSRSRSLTFMLLCLKRRKAAR